MSSTTLFPCVHCGYAYTKGIKVTRARSDIEIRRQRKCSKCNKGFVTYEVTADDYASLQAVRKLLRDMHPPQPVKVCNGDASHARDTAPQARRD